MNEELWGWENRISQDISNQYIITKNRSDINPIWNKIDVAKKN